MNDATPILQRLAVAVARQDGDIAQEAVFDYAKFRNDHGDGDEPDTVGADALFFTLLVELGPTLGGAL